MQVAQHASLELGKGVTVLATAVQAPLAGNYCPGGGGSPFAACPPGFFCPGPGELRLCPAVRKP